MISNKSLCRFCESFFVNFKVHQNFNFFSQQMYEILPITIRFHKHYCYEKMRNLGFVQERAGNIPVTFYLWWWAQPSICPWYLSFPLKQKRVFSAMRSICWWMDLDKNTEKKSINQSSYDIWGAASHPPSKGSVTPQQCQYCTISPPPMVVNVPPVYTLSNFLFVSPGTQTRHCHFTQLTTIRS